MNTMKPKLTIDHVVYCRPVQLGRLCKLKGNKTGHHLYLQTPHLDTLRNLARWFGDDLNIADEAIQKRQRRHAEMKCLSPDEREAAEKAIESKVQQIREEVDQILKENETNAVQDSSVDAQYSTAGC